MTTIVQVHFQQEDSVQVEKYKYIKPCLGMTATVEPGEDYRQVTKLLVGTVQTELASICAEIKTNN